jgi:ribosome-binding ATPase YchF (GTP1/OBG family)
MASFFTLGPTEAHAWLIREAEPAVEAAGKIHRDIARGFVRAEVIGWEDFLAEGPWKKLKGSKKLREEGRDHPLHDGDVMNVRFSA